DVSLVPESALQADMRRIVESIYGTSVPPISGLNIGRAYRSATEDFRYGGDMVDVFSYSDGSVSLAVVDVTGHGIPAATHASIAKYALRSCRSRGLSALESVRSLNRLCIENGAFEENDEFFATVFFAIVSPDRKTAEYVCAGHEAAYLFHGDESTMLNVNGPIVGLMDDVRHFSQDVIRLSVGDLVVAVTDGFSEARNVDSDFLGAEALVDVILRNRLRDAAWQAEALTRRAHEYGGGLHDYVAALVVRMSGS
ncbi:MAG: serine/threonine-protein phosphatase, partial [Candidatus Eremiobacteraeota bacterium]|nr:serine/threonine-protein phosphatase [Candidatus Eremiobacteraeota bacterium]